MIAVRAEGEQALQLMIAIGAARTDMEREIDLGIGGFGEHAAP